MRPHDIVNQIGDGLTGAVRGLGSGMVGAVKGVGNQINRALDKPFEMTIHKQGPQHMVGDVADGALNAVNDVGNGVVGAVQDMGHGVMDAFGEPPKNFGFPPDLGGIKLPGKK